MENNNQPPLPDTTQHLEALIVSHEKHAKQASNQRETIIRQNEKNNPAPILDAQLQKLGDIHEALKQREGPVADQTTVTLKGLKGDKGDQGEKGDTGEKGETGRDGPQGPKGDEGFTGPVGPQGEAGPAGPRGVPGPKGDQGQTGKKGDKGDPGRHGSPDTAEDIVKKLLGKLSYNSLRDLPNLESFRSFTAGAETQVWVNGRLFSNQVRVFDFLGSGFTINDLGGGRVAITASGGGGGTNIATEVVAAVQAGNDVSIDLTQLSHPVASLQLVLRNGAAVTPGSSRPDGETTYQRSGSTITVYNANSTDDFLINYTY